MSLRSRLVLVAAGFLEGRSDREALALAIRAFVFDILKKKCSAVADDLAQEVTLKVLKAFERGTVASEELPKYAVTAACNRHRSYCRNREAKRAQQAEPLDDTLLVDDTIDIERQYADDDEQHRRLVRLQKILPTMPSNYREAIVAHYVEGQSIEALVEQEITVRLASKTQDPDDPLLRSAERSKARNTVDQRLSRARSWLAKQLKEEEK